MSYQPDINPSDPTGQKLQVKLQLHTSVSIFPSTDLVVSLVPQAAIQKELAFRGWSAEDDTVMA